MKLWQQVAVAIGCFALILVAIPVGGGMLLGLLLIAGSERTIYQRVVAPDGRHEARVQFDDAGAVSGWAKVVFIKSPWLPLDTPWLSCRAFFGEGTDHISVSWPNDTTLLVLHGFKSEDAYTDKSCGPIKIVSKFDPKLVSEQP